ncbi:uncharacterized protein BO97DRAFT_350029 [Aspergillus homomorphus CBS 101889]|uniref:Apple domain-containing protein n=1 Tax=Aspergillus homomorphus (strain CBS 101889) TaxID=1450537 RepID=A0A395HQF1_ASPHC|nr:hypothetical protein BO97DRAFT_350029 [Aspergillus homomorphus CBS 101889]RAL10171.1 hypothetical protein BO97DRAFT_350029 [Aspergillus homomorphus CBS 101889]
MSAMFIPIVAALLLGQVAAKVPVAFSSPVASSQVQFQTQAGAYCHTKLGTSSIPGVLPTSTITRTRHDPTPVIITSTTQGTVTEIPALVTVTVTDYVTTTTTSTADSVTDTFSTTSTELITSTLILTPPAVTATVAVTVTTTSTYTSTIPTSDGFTPLAKTLPTSTAAKRSLLSTEEEDCAAWLDDYQYPQAVECHQKIVLKTTSVETVTAVPITTTLKGSTTTTTVTSTITTSSVVVPSAVSITLSYSTTSTITESSTVAAVTTTVTTANTVSVATSTTMLNACATNNVAGLPLSSDYGNFAGQYMYLVSFTNIPGESLTVGNAASAYDCCVSCQESNTCAMSYYNHVSSAVTYCYLIHTTSCNSASTYAKASLHSSPATIQMSNGPCGHVQGVQNA